MVQRPALAAGTLAALLLTALLAATAPGASAIAPLTPEEERIAEDLLRAPSVPPVPDENNAAIIYRRVFELMERDDEEYGEKAADREKAVFGNMTALETGMPELIPFVEEGSDRKPTGYEILYKVEGMECDFAVDWTKGPAAELRHLSDMRRIARLLRFQARFDQEKNRPERALKHIRLIFTLSRHVSAEPCLVSNLVAIAIESIGTHTLMNIAFQHRNGPEILESAAALLRSKPKRKMSAAEVVRANCRLMVSYFLRLVSNPEAMANDFTNEVYYLLRLGDSLQKRVEGSKAEEPEREQGGVALRWSFEYAVGLPIGSFNDDTFRPIVKKMAVFFWQEGERLACAIEQGPEEAHRIAMQWSKEAEKAPLDVPESFLARVWLPSAKSGVPFAISEIRTKAAIAILEAMARGDTEMGSIPDPLGKPCKVVWFDDLVYFESASQWDKPHDLDFCLGGTMTFEDYQERLKEEELQPEEAPPGR